MLENPQSDDERPGSLRALRTVEPLTRSYVREKMVGKYTGHFSCSELRIAAIASTSATFGRREVGELGCHLTAQLGYPDSQPSKRRFYAEEGPAGSSKADRQRAMV